MKRQKTNNQLKATLQQPRVMVGIFLVVVVGLVGLLYSAMHNQQKRSQPSEILTTQTVEATPDPDSSPTTSPLPEIVDEVKDGVYTNYTYGFSFEYDEELFPYVDLTGTKGVTFSSNKERNWEPPSLGVVFSGSNFIADQQSDLYKECASADINTFIREKMLKRYDGPFYCGWVYQTNSKDEVYSLLVKNVEKNCTS